MSDKSYPNARDCEHGSQRGYCANCDLAESEAELLKAEARAELAESIACAFAWDLGTLIVARRMGPEDDSDFEELAWHAGHESGITYVEGNMSREWRQAIEDERDGTENGYRVAP